MVSRGWIGVQIQPVTSDIAEGLGLKGPRGALVAEPQADSPAAKAGILSGDVITEVNGHAVKDAHDLARQIGSMTPGATAKLTVWRKGEEKSFSLTLGRGAAGARSTRGESRLRRSRSELAETWLVARSRWGDCRQRLRRSGRDRG